MHSELPTKKQNTEKYRYIFSLPDLKYFVLSIYNQRIQSIYNNADFTYLVNNIFLKAVHSQYILRTFDSTDTMCLLWYSSLVTIVYSVAVISQKNEAQIIIEQYHLEILNSPINLTCYFWQRVSLWNKISTTKLQEGKVVTRENNWKRSGSFQTFV